MNLPKDFPEIPVDFPELEAIREKMAAHTEPTIDIQLQSDGIPIFTKFVQSVDEHLSDGSTVQLLEYRKKRVVFYIPKVDRKYHILNCETRQEWGPGKYKAARPRDGQFTITKRGEEVKQKLKICQFCLSKLGLYNIYDVDNFPLADWLDVIEPSYEPPPIDGPDGPNLLPRSRYPLDWKFLSKQCRERSGWRCEECHLDFNHDNYHLHAHHIDRDPENNSPDNLQALCRGCHAEKEGQGHQNMKKEVDYQIFLAEYGKEWREARTLINAVPLVPNATNPKVTGNESWP